MNAIAILHDLAANLAHDSNHVRTWTADDIRTMSVEDRATRETVARARFAVTDQENRRTETQ